MATDVPNARTLEVLAERVDVFGGVDLLSNTAGIAGDRPRASWEQGLDKWPRALDVHLMGVIQGLRSFVHE